MQIQSFLIRLTFSFAILGHHLASGQQEDIKFERLERTGLSQNTIVSITQDKMGFLWVGTQDGLNKWDGYKYTTYSSDINRRNSLIHNYITGITSYNDNSLVIGTAGGLDLFDVEKERFNHFKNTKGELLRFSARGINCVYKDKRGILWVGSVEGLYRVDSINGSIRQFISSKEDEHSISNNNITCITEAGEDSLWIGTEYGLNRFSVQDETFYTYYADNKNNSLTHNHVTTVYEDNFKRVWVGTLKGLNLYDRHSDQFTQYYAGKGESLLSDNHVTVMLHDSKSNFWVGTRNGLNKLEEENGKMRFSHYSYKENNLHSLSNNWISALFEDRTNVVWIGTYFGGLNKYDLNGNKFRTIRHVENDENSISDNIVRAIVKDQEGNLWIGTNPGLNKIDAQTGKVTRFMHDPNNTNSLSDDMIRSLCFDNEGILWIGTRAGGINKYNPKTNQFIRYMYDPDDPYSFSGKDVRVIFKDSRGDMWLGSDGQGLFQYEMETGRFINYRPSADTTNSISSLYVYYAIQEDSKGNIWVGTWGGLNVLNRRTGKWTQYYHHPEVPGSLSDNYIKSLLIDKNNDVWAATAGGGLNKLIDPEKGIFEHYTIEDGLANNHTYGILQDNEGFIWISTNKGLSKFDPARILFRNYDRNDGLQDNEFNSGAFYKAEDGELFFGGINGLNAFYPKDIKVNKLLPQVVITDVQLFNEPVGVRDSTAELHLNKHIAYTKTISLPHDQKVISFEFAALHYANPKKNQYAYYLEGVDRGWVHSKADKRFVTYTNLSPGEYTFKVKASNNDGIWGVEPAVLTIIVTPPYWLTWWFLTLSSILFIGLVVVLHRFRLYKIEAQKRALEKVVIDRTEELDRKNRLLHEQNDEILTANEELEAIQDEIVAQNAELERQKLEVEKSYEDIRTISEIGNEIASMLDFEKIIEKVYEHVNELMDATEFGIGIYDKNTELINFALYIYDAKRLDGFTAPVDADRFSSWSIRNKKPVWIGNVHNEYHQYLKTLNEFEHEGPLLESLICIPLIVEGRTMGVVSVQSPKPNAYSQYQFDMLQALSTYIAVGLDNSNAYKSLEEKVEERTRDLNNAYKELVAANKNFDDFTYRSAHDLRGPLARLLGLCHLGKLEVKDDKGLRFLDYLEKVAFEMDRMLSRLLRSHQNKKSMVNKVPIDIQKIVDEILNSVSKTENMDKIFFKYDIDPEIRLESDQALIRILLENILQNSIRFKDPEKKVNEVKVRVTQDQVHSKVIISVIDNGIGIPKDHQKKVFDMFFIGSEASKGSGLGLYESKLIVERLGGEIFVTSDDKGYTEFQVMLNL